MVALSHLRPTAVRPVLLVGSPEIELPYARVASPINGNELFNALDQLVERRADALSRLEASDVVLVPESRRRSRINAGLADPAEYLRMRRPPATDSVLLVNKTASLRDYAAGLLAQRTAGVSWVDSEAAALDACRKSKISLVMINTSTPAVNPYQLCHAIKTDGVKLATVIFLVGKSFAYNQPLARQSGCDGYLTKPVTGNVLLSTFKKFLAQAR